MKVTQIPGLLRTGLALKVVGAVVALIALGNASIMLASWWAHRTTPTATVESIRGVNNLQVVDDRVLRGAAPSADGYRDLAAMGITTVVDLRAEPGAASESSLVQDLGMRYVHLPVRDGQVPGAGQISDFLRVVDEAPGSVFVHCGAGVGRTGAMVGAYLVERGASPRAALRRNLAVGPPSLEQMVFVAGLDRGDFDRVGAGVTMLSRVLDFPRRAWHVIGI